MRKIILHDPSLRDGNHAVKHQISLSQIDQYTSMADSVGIDVIEVGHGLGLGASSLQLGELAHDEREALRICRRNLKKTKLGVHLTPGYGQVKDLQQAFLEKIDVVRVATHCTEADIAEKAIRFASEREKEVYGCLIMSHMASAEVLLAQAAKMVDYGAFGVILMDSAGAYLPVDVKEKVGLLSAKLPVKIGFHAHNNLGLAVANSLVAAQSGAIIIDGTIKGFGAGCGNTPLEIIAAVLMRSSFQVSADLNKLLALGDFAKKHLIKKLPVISSSNILSGLYGVFCGFDLPIQTISEELKIDARLIYEELGRRKVVAGQEDQIIDAAYEIKGNSYDK